MKPSPNQQAIFDFIQNGKGSCIIEAVAGSGKTTTLVGALQKMDLKKDIAFLAFNKAIADELKKRTPRGVNVLTFNGMGHRAWLNMTRDTYVIKLNKYKISDIVRGDKFKKKWGEFQTRRLGGSVLKLVNLAKHHGLVPEDNPVEAIGLISDTTETWEHLVDHYDVQFDSEIDMVNSVQMARDVLNQSLNDWATIDFNDQLYMTVVCGATMQKYDMLLIDEAQDISEIVRAMLARSLKPNGRLIAVGDPCQAIYGFRGADSNSLNNIATTFNCIRLPLSISYRCPKNVVKEAKRYVSHIEPHESAPDGEVKDVGVAKPEMFKQGDLVVCRLTAPLIQLAYLLIVNKVPVTVKGRDIGKGLVILIEKLKPKGIDSLRDKLGEWKRKETQRILRKDPDANTTKIDDKYTCIMTFINCTKVYTVPELCRSIGSLFDDNSTGKVVLSTVHRVKGLEADKVFILNKELLPLPWAKKEWQRVQERNLAYVAVTRAKKQLFYVEIGE